MDSVGALLPFVLILVAFYLLIIRPARNRSRAQQRLSDQLAVGSKVMTTSGLYAVVAALEDDAVLLDAAPGVTLRYAKPAIARILPEPEPESDSEPEADVEAQSEPDTASAEATDDHSDAESTERPS